jgi:hypothetical protein
MRLAPRTKPFHHIGMGDGPASRNVSLAPLHRETLRRRIGRLMEGVVIRLVHAKTLLSGWAWDNGKPPGEITVGQGLRTPAIQR